MSRRRPKGALTSSRSQRLCDRVSPPTRRRAAVVSRFRPWSWTNFQRPKVGWRINREEFADVEALLAGGEKRCSRARGCRSPSYVERDHPTATKPEICRCRQCQKALQGGDRRAEAHNALQEVQSPWTLGQGVQVWTGGTTRSSASTSATSDANLVEHDAGAKEHDVLLAVVPEADFEPKELLEHKVTFIGSVEQLCYHARSEGEQPGTESLTVGVDERSSEQ